MFVLFNLFCLFIFVISTFMTIGSKYAYLTSVFRVITSLSGKKYFPSTYQVNKVDSY